MSLNQTRVAVCFATVLLWVGVLVYACRVNPFNVITNFLNETLIALGFITLAIQYLLRNRLHSWLTATFLAGVIVALAQWFNVI